MSAAVQPRAPSQRLVATVPLLLVGVVLLMVVPLTPFLLDLLLATSVALSLALLIISIHIEKPLDLSAFPTILLFVTLLRLALNVASTRLILIHGGESDAAAGNVIRAFGEFVIGGNYVVGGTVFLLLIVINFVVITKGASRVAEVSARFTLDALPGKQMAIDADLASGAITQADARVRRKEIEQEADFFGAMDGASKFVRGDAVAALLMTGINVVVGFIVGVLQQSLTPADAAARYTILSVGDGLASQLPALLVSTAAAVVVTRASAGAAFAPSVVRQLGTRQPALYATAGVLGLIGLVPGVPFFPFALLAGAITLLARQIGPLAESLTAQTAAPQGDAAASGSPADTAANNERTRVEEMLPLDLLELELGFELVPFVDVSKGGELVERIGAIRKNLAGELGVIVPSIRIRDNLRMRSTTYRLLLSGNEVGRGDLRPGKWLAMDPTGSLDPLPGESVREPAFGLPARWVGDNVRERAEALGYTVVDAPTVAATHITEMLRSIAPELLGRAEAQELVDVFARANPKLVDEVVPSIVPLGDVIKVLRALLREGISVRDLRTIFEAIADNAREVKDLGELVERVRQRLARHITSRFRGEDDRVAALVLDPRVEELFRKGGPDAAATQRLLASLDQAARAFAGIQTPPAVLCAPDVRRAVFEFLSSRIAGLNVLSYREIDATSSVRTLGMVSA